MPTSSRVRRTRTLLTVLAAVLAAVVALPAAASAAPAEQSPIAARYAATGGETGPLGPATGPEVCGLAGGGCTQPFARGAIWWSPGTDASIVGGAIRALFEDRGVEDLGYPLADLECGLRSGGCWTDFEYASVFWSPATGAHVVDDLFGSRWVDLGAEDGRLGYPIGDPDCSAVACAQDFQGGTLLVGDTGERMVVGAIRGAWLTSGGVSGRLGLPNHDEDCSLTGGGCRQGFQSGIVYWSPAGGAHPVVGTMWDRWAQSGFEVGSLGYPTSDGSCLLFGDGCAQHFQGGSVYWSAATGARVVTGAIRAAWAAGRWEGGVLRYPVTEMFCGLRGGGCGQQFQGGSIYWSPASGAHAVGGAIRASWGAQGWENGPLGFPTSDMTCVLRDHGCGQQFQGGSVYWSPATGTRVVSGAIRAVWGALGYENGRLAYPTGDMFCGLRGGGCGQQFQGGSVYWSPATGAHAVTDVVRDRWAQQGWENGPLGYPVADAVYRPYQAQRFQGGIVDTRPR